MKPGYSALVAFAFDARGLRGVAGFFAFAATLGSSCFSVADFAERSFSALITLSKSALVVQPYWPLSSLSISIERSATRTDAGFRPVASASSVTPYFGFSRLGGACFVAVFAGAFAMSSFLVSGV